VLEDSEKLTAACLSGAEQKTLHINASLTAQSCLRSGLATFRSGALCSPPVSQEAGADARGTLGNREHCSCPNTLKHTWRHRKGIFCQPELPVTGRLDVMAEDGEG